MSELIPWSFEPGRSAALRGEIAALPLALRAAILQAGAADGTLDADRLLVALEPAIAAMQTLCTVAAMELEQATERARRKQNAQQAAEKVAERLIRDALSGIQAEVLATDGTQSASAARRWSPRDGHPGGFDPHGFFVYCLWGGDKDRPIYVGKSMNVMGRIGKHVYIRGRQIERVTLLRCKSGRVRCCHGPATAPAPRADGSGLSQ